MIEYQMTESALVEWLTKNGYTPIRKMPNGQLVGVLDQVYTTGLFTNLREYSYASRYCYEHHHDALNALLTWDGLGDPPGPWIKHKGLGGIDRLGPGALT